MKTVMFFEHVIMMLKLGCQKASNPSPIVSMNSQLFFQIMNILLANGESAVIHDVML